MNAAPKSRSALLLEEARLAPLHDYGSWYHEEAVAQAVDSRKPQS